MSFNRLKVKTIAIAQSEFELTRARIQYPLEQHYSQMSSQPEISTAPLDQEIAALDNSAAAQVNTTLPSEAGLSVDNNTATIVTETPGAKSADNAAYYGETPIPCIAPLFLTTQTQSLFKVVIGTDVTTDKMYRMIPKSDLVSDMQTRLAISDFTPFKKDILVLVINTGLHSRSASSPLRSRVQVWPELFSLYWC